MSKRQREFYFHYVDHYLPDDDKFSMFNADREMSKVSYQTRSKVLDSTNPGVLELDEFFKPQNHHIFKKFKKSALLSKQKPPNKIPARSIKLKNYTSSNKNNDNSSPSSEQTSSACVKGPPFFAVSRFNIDPSLQVCYSPYSDQPLAIEMKVGTIAYSLHKNTRPFSIGEVNLVETAAEESCLVQAIQLTLFFSSNQFVYPEPDLALDLFATCVELVEQLFQSEKNNSSNLQTRKNIFLSLEDKVTSEFNAEIVAPNLPQAEEMGGALREMAKLIRHLSTYLTKNYFRDLFSPLTRKTERFKIREFPDKKGSSIRQKVGLDFWRWISILGKIHSEAKKHKFPDTLILGSGLLMKELALVFENELRCCGAQDVSECLVSRLIPGDEVFPFTKIEDLTTIMLNSQNNSGPGLFWHTAMFHFHHLFVMLAYANVISTSTLIQLTTDLYVQSSPEFQNNIITSIVSLPFRCQTIDSIIRHLYPSFLVSSGGWFNWDILINTYFSTSFTEVCKDMLRKYGMAVTTFDETQSKSLFKKKANKFREAYIKAENYIDLLHHLTYAYLFYRSQLQHPKAHLKNNVRFKLEKAQAKQWKAYLSSALSKIQQVNKFFATSLGKDSTLVDQFKEKIFDFPFPGLKEL